MRTSPRNLDHGGRYSPIAAWAISLAVVAPSTPALAEEPRARSAAEVEARELSLAGDHARAAEKWAAVAETAEDPRTRTLAVFQSYQAWLAVFAEDYDVARLCRARALLAGMIDRDDIGDDVRREAVDRIADLDERLAEHGGAAECEDAEEGAEGNARGGLLPVRGSARPPALLPVPVPVGPVEFDGPGVDAPRRPVATARAFTIAGGVSLGVGVSLLGAMIYGLAVDARSAFALSGYTAKKIAGTLTADDWEQIEAIAAEGRGGARLAKITGVAGGVVVLTGAALLIHARRVRLRTLALYPAVGRGQAGLGLRGHF